LNSSQLSSRLMYGKGGGWPLRRDVRPLGVADPGALGSLWTLTMSAMDS